MGAYACIIIIVFVSIEAATLIDTSKCGTWVLTQDTIVYSYGQNNTTCEKCIHDIVRRIYYNITTNQYLAEYQLTV